ncbi:hypothetical protein Maq22A_c28085 [Methylobacterium aquaticum]|uniref:Uncharacterized protein n=1 Tax=Methylobacterium aquaticum TaxID=270351 RepID=A0A1Y0ZFL9_9HYPH|nr:hypothetical protein Maq22A_c28085 [Methylobacterium aquaticum]
MREFLAARLHQPPRYRVDPAQQSQRPDHRRRRGRHPFRGRLPADEDDRDPERLRRRIDEHEPQAVRVPRHRRDAERAALLRQAGHAIRLSGQSVEVPRLGRCLVGRLAALTDRREELRCPQGRRGNDLGPLHPVQPDLVHRQGRRHRLGEQAGQRFQPDARHGAPVLRVAGLFQGRQFSRRHHRGPQGDVRPGAQGRPPDPVGVETGRRPERIDAATARRRCSPRLRVGRDAAGRRVEDEVGGDPALPRRSDGFPYEVGTYHPLMCSTDGHGRRHRCSPTRRRGASFEGRGTALPCRVRTMAPRPTTCSQSGMPIVRNCRFALATLVAISLATQDFQEMHRSRADPASSPFR